jgi:hypothetical protein
MGKLEFGSRPWTEQLRDAIQRAVDEAGAETGPTDYAFSEVYVDPPTHLAEPGVTLGWCARIRGRDVDFTFEPADDVDFQVTTAMRRSCLSRASFLPKSMMPMTSASGWWVSWWRPAS